jgi:hypothetical protein
MYSIPNGPPGPSPARARFGPALCGPMAFSCRAVSGVVPNWRPRHGPMADFSGRASMTPRTVRLAATRYGTIVGGVEAEAATPEACGGRRGWSSGAPRCKPAQPIFQPPRRIWTGALELHPRSGARSRAAEVGAGDVWRRRPAVRGVVEAEAGAAGVLAPRDACRRGQIFGPVAARRFREEQGPAREIYRRWRVRGAGGICRARLGAATGFAGGRGRVWRRVGEGDREERSSRGRLGRVVSN